MDSPQANGSADHLYGALIEWSTPEIVNNEIREGDYSINNPFDKMEIEAANMSPFDLIPDQTTLRKEPPCENILSPLGEPEYRKVQSSLSLTDIDGIANDLKQNYKEQVKDDTVVRGQSKGIMENDKGNDISVVENKLIENQELKSEDVSIPDYNTMVDIEQIALCTEEEEKQIREQTQQRIKMLIEKAKREYEENYSRVSLLCTTSSDSSLNETKNVFNKGFIQEKLSSNSNSFNITSSGKTHDNTVNINENSPLPYDPNLVELDSLNPEWVVDSFMDCDNDSSTEVQITNNSVTVVGSDNNSQEGMSKDVKDSNSQVDIVPEAVNRLESVESKQSACQTVVTMKSTQNKRSLNKGLVFAKIPIEHIVQNYHDIETKEICHASDNSPHDNIKPVATSTPTIDISTIFKTSPSDSPVQSKNVLRRSVPNSSPNTPLNMTKCIQRSSSNNEIVLSDINVNKCELESKITKTQKPMALKTNKLSGLPVLKKFTSFKGKENVKPQ